MLDIANLSEKEMWSKVKRLKEKFCGKICYREREREEEEVYERKIN